MIFPLLSVSAKTFLHRFNAKSAWAANTRAYQITLMLKAAFKHSEYSSQGQRLNYPPQISLRAQCSSSYKRFIWMRLLKGTKIQGSFLKALEKTSSIGMAHILTWFYELFLKYNMQQRCSCPVRDIRGFSVGLSCRSSPVPHPRHCHQGRCPLPTIAQSPDPPRHQPRGGLVEFLPGCPLFKG